MNQILVILLLVLLVGVLPAWPYSAGWGYYPSGALGTILIVVLILALLGYQNFTQNYENFLIVLDYWIMPWLAIVLLDFYVFRHREPMGFSQAVPVNWNGLIAWVIGLAVSLLFIWEQFQVFGLKAHGPFASWFGDADFGYFIGFIVAGVIYVVLNRGRAPQH